MKEIYFHVGLGKTGSKYLQFGFFPKLKGVIYIPMTKYRKSVSIIKEAKEGKFIVSREFDRQFAKEIEWFSKYFRDVKPIMVLRRQDEWILSQYKRYIKNGYHWEFDRLFNLGNTGFFKIEDMLFYDKIKLLENTFSYKPLVLMYDELRSNPESFLNKIARYIGVTYDKTSIEFSKRHESYSVKQLKFIYVVSKYVNLIPGDSKLKKYAFVYPIRYPILFAANYLPEWLTPNIDFMPEKEKLEAIKKFFKSDWEKCVKYVNANSW